MLKKLNLISSFQQHLGSVVSSLAKQIAESSKTKLFVRWIKYQFIVFQKIKGRDRQTDWQTDRDWKISSKCQSECYKQYSYLIFKFLYHINLWKMRSKNPPNIWSGVPEFNVNSLYRSKGYIWWKYFNCCVIKSYWWYLSLYPENL